jgi:hypothetical protein
MRGLRYFELAKSADVHCFLRVSYVADHFIDRPIFNTLSGHGLSNASNSCSLARSSPNHFGQSISARMTGIRSCSSPIAWFGPLISRCHLAAGRSMRRIAQGLRQSPLDCQSREIRHAGRSDDAIRRRECLTRLPVSSAALLALYEYRGDALYHESLSAAEYKARHLRSTFGPSH